MLLGLLLIFLVIVYGIYDISNRKREVTKEEYHKIKKYLFTILSITLTAMILQLYPYEKETKTIESYISTKEVVDLINNGNKVVILEETEGTQVIKQEITQAKS